MAWDWLLDIGKEIAPAIIGGVINNNAQNKALDAQTQAGDKALALQKEMYDQSRQDLAPYRESGNAANAKLSQLMGLATPFDGSAYREKLLADHPLLFGGTKPVEKAATGFMPDMDPLELELRRREQDYRANDMWTPMKFQKRVGGGGNMNMDTVLRDFKDGQVNEYTGETFDKKRYLQYLKAKEDLEAAYPQGNFNAVMPAPEEIRKAFDEEQGMINRMTYQPSRSKQSFLGKYGAPLMLGAMTAGMGALAPAAAMAGSGSTALTGANIAKNAVSLSGLIGRKS